MNTTKTIHHHSGKLLAMFCLSLGFGFVQTDTITAQSQFNAGLYWEPFECENSVSANLQPNTSEQETGTSQVLRPTNVDPSSEHGVARKPQNFVDADSLKELSARQRAAAARRVKPYLGKPTAWQGYPSAQAVQLLPKQLTTAQKDSEFVVNNDADDAIFKKLLTSSGQASDLQPTTGDTVTAPLLNPAKTTTNLQTN